MDLSHYLAFVEKDASRIGEIASGNVALEVPPCPGWTVSDLVEHVGRVYRMVDGALITGERPEQLPTPPDGGDIAAWFLDAYDRMMTTFGVTDPESERWNWSVGPQVASFWWRRMAHETAVHRWDAESALGECEPIDPELAADGIDEWFDVHLRSDAHGVDVKEQLVSGSFHVHCTDTEGEWLAQMDGRQLELERAHRKGDVVMRGGASDVLLALWRRLPLTSVEIIGDESVLASWMSLPDI